MARGFDPAGPAPDAEGGEQLADRSAASFAADGPFLAETDEGFELFPAIFAAEFVKRHGTIIVEDFGPYDKGGSGHAGENTLIFPSLFLLKTESDAPPSHIYEPADKPWLSRRAGKARPLPRGRGWGGDINKSIVGRA
jgi:hypothetical protein